MSGLKHTVLLCFTTDPYQPIEEEFKITQQAIKILGHHGFKIMVLTKNPALAMRDIDLFKKLSIWPMKCDTKGHDHILFWI